MKYANMNKILFHKITKVHFPVLFILPALIKKPKRDFWIDAGNICIAIILIDQTQFLLLYWIVEMYFFWFDPTQTWKHLLFNFMTAWTKEDLEGMGWLPKLPSS